MLHAGLDLSRRRLDVCLVDDAGAVVAQIAAAPDADGLRHLAMRVSAARVRAVIESMNGARFVHDTLAAGAGFRLGRLTRTAHEAIHASNASRGIRRREHRRTARSSPRSMALVDRPASAAASRGRRNMGSTGGADMGSLLLRRKRPNWPPLVPSANPRVEPEAIPVWYLRAGRAPVANRESPANR